MHVDPLRHLLHKTLTSIIPSIGGFLSAKFDNVAPHLKGDLFFGNSNGSKKKLLFFRGAESGGNTKVISTLFNFRKKLI